MCGVGRGGGFWVVSWYGGPVPERLVFRDQSDSGIPWGTEFEVADAVPLAYGINVGVALQSLPGYLYGTSAQYALTGVSGPSGVTTNNPPNGAGTVWQITRNTVYPANAPCVAQGRCAAGQRVNGRDGSRCGVAREGATM